MIDTMQSEERCRFCLISFIWIYSKFFLIITMIAILLSSVHFTLHRMLWVLLYGSDLNVFSNFLLFMFLFLFDSFIRWFVVYLHLICSFARSKACRYYSFVMHFKCGRRNANTAPSKHTIDMYTYVISGNFK